MFAKNKISPLEGKTLPTLELLTIYLALKCLPQVISAYTCSFSSLHIFSDSQISLSWVLSQDLKMKQVFIKNRMQDIRSMEKSLASQNLRPNFHFVRTDENPADLLTRGLSFREFSQKFDFWEHGPRWATSPQIYWPAHELRCLPGDLRFTVFLTISMVDLIVPLIDFLRFSSVQKLFRVCAHLFSFADRCRRVDSASDRISNAQFYCLKVMQ